MYKRVLIICFCLYSAFRLSGQVNLQTGSASFSLPVFNWDDDKSRLNSIIALTYASGNGLKVSEVASNVGQGWNLVAGGVIARMQVGEPDDQAEKPGNEWDITKYPPGILFATKPAANGCPVALTKYPIYGWKNQLYAQHNIIGEDKQLDYFSFQFNGKTGMFVLDPSNIGVAKSIGDSKMKITFQLDAGLISQGIRTRITSFAIHDADGLIYRFARKGLTKVLKSGFCDAGQVQLLTQPKLENGGVYHEAAFDNDQVANPFVVGSWYLTEIEDALTHRKVLFSYTTRNITNPAGDDIIYNEEKNYSIIQHKKSVTQTPVLTSVTYPDGHMVVVNYGSPRLDLTGDYAVSSIDVTYQGRSLSRHELTTSYFILNRYGTPVSEYQKKISRLCLMAVRKTGIDLKEDTPPYKFDYFLGSGAADDFVPPPFFYAKDIWGFYNGSNSAGYNFETIPLNGSISSLSNDQLRGLCFRRNNSGAVTLNPKNGYSKNGLLRQVIYPTGGTLTYKYEQNYAVLAGTHREVGGVHVSETSSTDGGFSNGCANPVSTQYNYVMNGAGSNSSMWGVELPVNTTSFMTHYQPEYRSYKWSFSCMPFGCCYWNYQYPGILSQQQSIDLTGFQKFMNAAAPVLGIISVVSTIMDVVNLCLAATPAAIVAVVIDVICGLITLVVTCFGTQERDRYYTNYYNTDLNAISPLPAQYKRVEVVDNPATRGKTIQEFTSEEDYPVWEPANPANAAKQRFAPWAYGLPKKTTVLDAAGNKVKETENVYNFGLIYYQHCGWNDPRYDRTKLLKQPLNTISAKCQVKKSTSQRNTDWSDINIYNNPASYMQSSDASMGVDIYNMYTGRTELYKTFERVYKPGNSSAYLESVTEYLYNNENFQPSMIKTKKSDGQFEQKNIYYTVDYVKINNNCFNGTTPGVTNAAINTMVQNNLLSIPVETNTMSGFDGSMLYTSSTATVFGIQPNGDIKPAAILEGRLTQPAQKQPLWGSNPYWQFGFNNPLFNPDNPNYTFYKQAQSFVYDAAGNLRGLKDEGGRQITNIYDYSDKYIIASAINADPLSDKVAYTSFETAGTGGWTVNGSIAWNTASAVTGSRSLSFGTGNSITTALSTTKSHRVSFWASNSTVTVSGGVLQKSAPTVNGFTYYEYEIPQGYASITIYGNCLLDELRLYPATARMRTIAYDAAIGKTAECDENNRITYYEYDKLGRLLFIKDEKRNIVKMNEYNNISESKQNGCPGIYYNKLISELFTKNNCGQGYIGSNVTYSIPANTYSSALSQQDADNKAENAILANGQNYANSNGSCIPLYYNTVQSQNFTTENCPPGYTGGTVTYTVPAGKYSTTLSQAAANQLALAEIEANGQAYANTAPNSVCIISNLPEWRWLEGAPWYCLSVNGALPPHLFVLETDINPNSTSFNQTRWSDVGPSDKCPSGNYYNNARSQVFTRNNCGPGYTGGTVTYTVPAGKYSSVVSQADADQQAQNDINANGQNYANLNGTCNAGCSGCTGNDRKCINNICESGTWGVVSSVYKKVLVDGFLQWRWECTYRYCFSDGTQSTYFMTSLNTSSCPITCFTD